MVAFIAANAQFGNLKDLNNLNEAQLDLAFKKSEKNIRTGKILTGVGVGLAAIGTVITVNAFSDMVTESIDSFEPNTSKLLLGGAVASVGSLMIGIGIPVWAFGAMRKNDIEIVLAKYKTSQAYGIGVKLRF